MRNTIAAGILALLAITMVVSVLGESQTWDEAIYLSSGFSYLKTSDYRLNREHPPLAKILCALPLLALQPQLPVNDPSWAEANQVAFGQAFLYKNTMPADRMLFAGRLVTILLTVTLGLVLYLWTSSRAGPGAGLLALLLYAFDPNIIAHGRYATNDVAVTLFSFLTVIAFDWALSRGRLLTYALAGLALGAALATKFSAAFLLPVLVILAGLEIRKRRDWRFIAIGTSIATAVAWGLMVVVAHGDAKLYTDGIVATWQHTRGGQLSYLFGMESTQGWWWYFPAAFALKSPVGLLTLILAAIGFTGRRITRLGDLQALVVPLVVYGTLCLFDRADIGIRYLLPMYPFLFALVGIAAARYIPKPITAVCVAAILIESLSVYPNYLAFFNVAVGGPGNGPKYLLDSNIDWGQDAKKLANWLRARGTNVACVSYFGTVPLDYYGIRVISDAPHYDQYVKHTAPHCFVAVSVNYLYGEAILGSSVNRWLRGRRPIDKVGYSIYIYDLRAYH